MWIIPKNISDTYPSVVVTRESEVDSEEFSLMCEKSLMSKSKPSLSPTWLRRWKRIKYIQHLCSRTLKNSHSESFVDALTSSVVDSPASRSQQQASEKEQKTQDTCSPTSLKGSESVDPSSSSLRTSRESSAVRQPMENQFSSMSFGAWRSWIIEQRQEYSQRVKSVPRIRGSGYSSWPTPTARDVKGPSGRAYKGKPENLADIELCNWPTHENWATPNTMDGMAPRSEEALRRQATTTRKGRKSPANLREQVDPKAVEIYKEENWPTPTVAEGGKIGNNPNYGQLGLSNHPQVHGYEVQREPLHKDRKGLPKAGQPDPTKNSSSGKSQESWGTPSTRDMSHPGKNSKQKRITTQISNPNKLNPSWVEQLMGLPVGWTQLPTEWID